jgi:hypothetical protein
MNKRRRAMKVVLNDPKKSVPNARNNAAGNSGRGGSNLSR